MKKDFSTEVLDLDGKVIKLDDSNLTMQKLANIAIQASDTRECSADEKGKKFSLMIKIHNGGVVEVSSEEITLLKDLAGRALTTLGYGRFIKFLETDYKPAVESKSKK